MLGLAPVECIFSATITVTSNKDSGAGSLRQALIDANSSDVIRFDPSVTIIYLDTSLTIDTNQITISGTQDSFGPGVEITTSTLVSVNQGFLINSDNNLLEGLSIHSFAINGIRINPGSDNNQIKGCFIGTDLTGIAAKGNGLDGIDIRGSGNIIGGDVSNILERNIIVDNFDGVSILGNSNNHIRGNYIGVDQTGTTRLGNQNHGISIQANSNTIGGTSTVYQNVIGGNASSGIHISGDLNTIQNNLVGLYGSYSVANTSYGIFVDDNSDQNQIITNTIAYNSKGIYFSASSGTQNLINQNSIYDHELTGIDLSGGTEDSAGVTQNDSGDADNGGNLLLNYPVIAYASISSIDGSFSARGTLDISTLETTSTIEIYIADNQPDNHSSHGEGKIYVASLTPTDTVVGSWSITITGSHPVNVGDVITAITIDQNNNSSEFSLNADVETDSDGDLWPDSVDNCLANSNFSQLDSDGDGVGNVCDNCAEDSNSNQADFDNDGQGDVCDIDDDNDGFNDEIDAFPKDASESMDTDNDGLGDNADTDDDNDGFNDTDEEFLGTNKNQLNSKPIRQLIPYFNGTYEVVSLQIINHQSNPKNVIILVFDKNGNKVNHLSLGQQSIVSAVPQVINLKTFISNQGWIEIQYSGSETDITSQVTLEDQNVSQRYPGMILSRYQSDIQYATYFKSSEGSLQAVLTNTTNQVVSGTLLTFDSSGAVVQSQNVSMNSKEQKVFSIDSKQLLGMIQFQSLQGRASDVISVLQIEDPKLGNREYPLIDASLQTSNLTYKNQTQMGQKIGLFAIKPEIQKKKSKLYLVISNVTNQSMKISPQILTKKKIILLKEKIIPAKATLKIKLNAYLKQKMKGVMLYHPGTGSSLIASIHCVQGKKKLASVFDLVDSKTIRLNLQKNGVHFTTQKPAKSQILLTNLSQSLAANLTLKFYSEAGQSLYQTTLTINPGKIVFIKPQKLVPKNQNGYLNLSCNEGDRVMGSSQLLDIQNQISYEKSLILDQDSE